MNRCVCQVDKGEKSQVKVIAGLKAHIDLPTPRHKKSLAGYGRTG